MKFKVKAFDSNGAVKDIIREANDKFALYHVLKEEQLTIVSAEEIATGGAGAFFSMNLDHFHIPFVGGVSMHEKILFARNLAAMLEAGLPMSRALSVMERQTKNHILKEVINDISERIKKGLSLSQAMKQHTDIFSAILISMTAAGEESGKLAESLNTVGVQMEKTYVLQEKIKGAMIYPSIILLAMLGIGTFLLMYIVPTLTATFKELKVELPASTQFIIAVSDFVRDYNLFILLGIVVTVLGVYAGIQTKQGKRILDWIVLHIPVVASLVKETNSARTARTFASLISSGVSVVDSLSITNDVIQNSYFKEVIEKAKKKIQLGEPMSEVFTAADHLYPTFVGEMIAVGEETGELSNTLLKVAVFYEGEVEQKTKDMSTVIEPFLMIFIGAGVGFFAISMIAPTYSLVDSL